MADQDVMVTFGAKIDALNNAVEQIKNKLGEVSSHAESMGHAFGSLKEFIAEAFTVEAIVKFIERMSELGAELENTRLRLGGSIDQIFMMKGMAELAGTSLGGFASAMERLSLNVQKSTRDAFNPQSDALRILGINAKNYFSTDLMGRVDMLRGSVAKYGEGLNLTNVLMTAGGRGVAQLLPLLKMNDEEYQHITHSMKEYGDAIKTAEPEMLKTHQSMTLLASSSSALGATVFNQLSPAINGTISVLRNLFDEMRRSVTDGGVFGTALDVLTFTVRTAASAFAALVAGVLALGTAIHAVFTLAAGDVANFEENAKKAQESFERIGNALKNQMKEIWSAPSGAPTNMPSLPDPREVNFGLQQAMRDQLKIINERYAEEVIKIKETYGSFFFTEAAKTQALQGALQERFNAEVAAGEKVNVARAKFEKDYAKIMADSRKAQEASLNQFFGAFESAFNGQLRGLLAGTTKFKDAFKAILGDMIIWAIQQFLKMALQWVAHEVIMTTASTAGSAARTTAATTETGASMAMMALKGIKSIMNSAAETFAGVFAFLSPAMGPAAAAPAAASAATVAASAGAIVLARGTPFVASTGLALIHQGEAVVPASANPFAPGALGGGMNAPPVSVHIVNNSSMSRAMLQEQARIVAKAVADQWRFNPSTRPRY